MKRAAARTVVRVHFGAQSRPVAAEGATWADRPVSPGSWPWRTGSTG